MLKNTTLLVAACLIAGSPLLAQDKKVVPKEIPPHVVHQKEVTAADVKKKPVIIKNEEVRSPAAKQKNSASDPMVEEKLEPVAKQKVKFAPPVVKKDVASSAKATPAKSKMVKFKPPVIKKDAPSKPEGEPVIEKVSETPLNKGNVPPPPPPVPPKKKA